MKAIPWLLLAVGLGNGQNFNTDCDLGPDALNDLAADIGDGSTIPQTCIPFTNDATGATIQRCFYTFVSSCASGNINGTPLVLDLHRMGDCPVDQAGYSGWLEQAAQNCFAVIWPTGNVDANLTSQPCWSSPGGLALGSQGETAPCCCYEDDNLVPSNQTGDLDFLRLVVAIAVPNILVNNNITIDTKRIYMAGHSDGCIMSTAMAAVHSDLVAAVCCHAGAVLTPIESPYIPTPVWRIHGNADFTIPFDGRAFDGVNLTEFTGAIEAHDYWGIANGCQSTEETTFRRNIINTGTIRRYLDCIDGANVELVTITGGGHNPYLELLDVPVPTVFDTTALAWEFCSSFTSAQEPLLNETIAPTPFVAPSSAPTTTNPPPPTSMEPSMTGTTTNPTRSPMDDGFVVSNCDVGPDAFESRVNEGFNITRSCLPTITGERCFFVYVPDCASGSSPLVVDIHGLDECPETFAEFSNWLEQATENCFVVTWPTGNVNSTITDVSCWSVPAGLESGPQGQPTIPCCCSVPPNVTDDLDFLRSVVTSVVVDTPTIHGVTIDTRRIYMAGHSNGCMLSMAMAAQHSDLVAAVCCHAGSVLTPVAADYIATPVWRIHGNADAAVPFNGEFDDDLNVQIFTGAIEGHDYWAQANGCQTMEETQRFRRNLNFGTTRRYTNCTNGAGVELVTITGGGHDIYLGALDLPIPVTFDTTALAWDFCSAYSSLEEPFLEGVTPGPTFPPGSPTSAPVEAPTTVPTDPPVMGVNTDCPLGPDALSDLVDGTDIPRICIPTNTQGESERCYYVYVPPCALAGSALVVDIHRLDSCPALLAGYSGWLELATENCFVVIWPTGIVDPSIAVSSCWSVPGGLVSNDGQSNTTTTTIPCCCLNSTSDTTSGIVSPEVTQDLAFIRAMVAHAIKTTIPTISQGLVTIDTKRIYMAGHSNGCILSMAMAALHSDMVAAVCCHAGAVLTPVSPDTYIPTPVWRVHGSSDQLVPYNGRVSVENPALREFTGAIAGHDYWAQANGCSVSSTDSFRRNLNFVTSRRYSNCTNNADVELLTISIGGNNPYLDLLDVPFPTTFDTTALAWDFCSSYSSQREPDLDSPSGASPSQQPTASATPSVGPSSLSSFDPTSAPSAAPPPPSTGQPTSSAMIFQNMVVHHVLLPVIVSFLIQIVL